MVPTYMKGEYVIRFAVCAEKATEDDMDAAWKIIQEFASTVLPLTTLPTTPILWEIKNDENFGSQKWRRV